MTKNPSEKHISTIELSVVIPMFNEADCVENTLKIVRTIIENLQETFEIVVVDDGSTDDSALIVKEISKIDPRVRVISLNRNRGHMKALEAGLLASRGELIVSIDADLQDNPSDIEAMYRMISEKDLNGNRLFDVIQSVRIDRSTDTFIKKASASLYYRAMRRLTGTEVIQHAADFRMLTRYALDIVNQIPESEKVYRLLLPALGFRIGILETKREERYAGKSKYSFRKMLGLAVDSLINFSNRPLRIIINFGLLTLLAMVFYCIFSFYQWTAGRNIPGWTSLVIIVLLSNSLILISLGVIGEYVGRLFEQAKGRPNVIWTEHLSGTEKNE